MKKICLLISFAGLFVLLGCGKPTPSSVAPVADKGGKQKTPPPKFDVNDKWKIVEKNCGQTPVAIKPLEGYRIDESNFYRFEKASESGNTVCRLGVAYSRIAQGFSSEGTTYTENGFLRGLVSKTTCWRKQNGNATGNPISSVTNEEKIQNLVVKMTVTGNAVAFDFKDSPDCPTGVLSLTLVRQ